MDILLKFELIIYYGCCFLKWRYLNYAVVQFNIKVYRILDFGVSAAQCL